MTREKLEKYIQNNYSAEPDYPWVKYPDDEIRMLLDMSFEATAPKIRKKKKEEF